jgi:hypothetical protein
MRHKAEGFTEEELFNKFSENARFIGGGCYRIMFMNREIYANDTLDLFENWKDCFIKREGRYFYK